MTVNSVAYYTSEVAGGREDYYTGRGEAEGRWLGRGAATEGLTGSVDAEQLARLFAGKHPVTGEPLGAAYKVRAGVDQVTGWDLTFSAPKSVSALWAVGGGEVGLEVREAHDAAVKVAVDYLEEHAAFSRTGRNGVRQVDTDGLVAAGFVHRQSRAGDPQLHTHVLVSNRVRCSADGVWRALDSRALHKQLKPAGMLYQAALRAELTTRLGVEWTEVSVHGQAEIAGVPEELQRLFSQRRAVAQERVAELTDAREVELGRPLTPRERRAVWQHAVLETRQAKSHDEGDIGLHDRWFERAVEAGVAPERWLPSAVDRVVTPASPQVSDILDDLEAARSTWTRADVVKAVAAHAPATGDADDAHAWIESTVDAVLAERGVVRLAAPELDVPAELRRRDGQSVFSPHDSPRFTTTRTLQREQHVLNTANAGVAAGRAVADAGAVVDALRFSRRSPDQADAIEALCRSGDAVQVLVGPAGAGKSATMATAASAWRTSGIPVRGVAVSAVAARVLREEAGIPADTIAKLLGNTPGNNHDGRLPDTDRAGNQVDGWLPGADGAGNHRGNPLPWRSVLVVDEAGMASTRDLHALLALTEEVEGKLVLVGDPHQLGAVEAGGLFTLLCEQHAVELGTLHRFTHDWEADASLRLRAHDASVVELYERYGRVEETDDAGAVASAAHAWFTARDHGVSCVITAADNDTVGAICEHVRHQRVDRGQVEADGVTCGGQVVGVGDEIVTVRNDRRLHTDQRAWVHNGDRWHVDARHPDGALTVSSLDGRGTLTLPSNYTAEHVHLAYAVTVHKAQGMTVDHAITIIDSATSREHLYVGMTRGRDTNHALVITEPADLDHHEPAPTGREVLVAAMGRSSADQAATAHLRDTLARSESLAQLVPKFVAVDAEIKQGTPADVSRDIGWLENRRRLVEQHHRPGRLTAAGRDAARELRSIDRDLAELRQKLTQRERWLADHKHLFHYREQLQAQITERRQQLGTVAAVDPPQHLIDRLGPVPDDDRGRNVWIERAGRIDGYLDRYNLDADQLDVVPRDRQQQADRRVNVEQPVRARERDIEHQELWHRLAQRQRTIELDRGIGLEL